MDRDRLLFQIAVWIWYFAAGADRSAVIPTVNDYIGYLGANQAYIGIVISIFAVGSIISAPTMGRLADRIGTSRPLVLTGICCHLSGSVVYFLAPYLPGNEPAAWVSFGRFLAGIGYGLDGAIMGTLTKCAKEEDRSAVISQTILLRQVGVVLGPLSIFGIQKLNFTLPGGRQVNQYNALGFCLTFLWLLVFILVFALYHDKDLVIKYSNRETPEKQIVKTDQNGNEESKGEMEIMLPDNELYKFIEIKPITSIFREQIVVCLIGSFCGMFLQSALETMFSPMAKRLLGFTSVENSITYVCIGVIAVAGYASIKFATQKFKDRTLLLFGLSIELSNTLILLIIIPTASYRATQLYIALVICVFLQVFCMAYLVVSSATMLSKFSPAAKQATIQGLRIAVETFATILAPQWIGWTLNIGFVINFSVPFIFMILAMTLLLLSFKVMEPSHIKKFSSSTSTS